MLRRACLLSLSLWISSLGIGTTSAEEPYQAWWKFLEGDWTYVITPGDVSGKASWRIEADGKALVGRFTDSQGTGVEISGWQSDTKTNTVQGYGSNGIYWQFEIKEFSDDTWEGTARGINSDGQTYAGTSRGRKVGPDHYEWQIEGKLAGGDAYAESGKCTRATTPTSTREQFTELGELLAGRWASSVTLIADWPEFSKKQGDQVNGYATCTWTADKRVLIEDEVIADGQNTSFYFWDPDSRTIKMTRITSSGSTGMATYWKDGETWHWKFSSTLSDGKKSTGTGTLSFEDDGNTYIADGTLYLDGVELPHYHDVYTRIDRN